MIYDKGSIKRRRCRKKELRTYLDQERYSLSQDLVQSDRNDVCYKFTSYALDESDILVDFNFNFVLELVLVILVFFWSPLLCAGVQNPM
jgi:uncharacterized membrane protein YagU involved in acid resistance